MRPDGRYAAARARALARARTADPQAGPAGDVRAGVAELTRPCTRPGCADRYGRHDGLVHDGDRARRGLGCTIMTAAGRCPCPRLLGGADR